MCYRAYRCDTVARPYQYRSPKINKFVLRYCSGEPDRLGVTGPLNMQWIVLVYTNRGQIMVTHRGKACLKIMWSTCNLKKLDVNCCETVKFRPNLSENEILMYYNVVGNRRAFLLSSNLQRNTEVHKTLTQICLCGTVLMVAVSASLTDGGN